MIMASGSGLFTSVQMNISFLYFKIIVCLEVKPLNVCVRTCVMLQDANWIALNSSLQCESLSDIFLLFKSSDFITHDLTQPWVNPHCCVVVAAECSSLNEHLRLQTTLNICNKTRVSENITLICLSIDFFFLTELYSCWFIIPQLLKHIWMNYSRQNVSLFFINSALVSLLPFIPDFLYAAIRTRQIQSLTMRYFTLRWRCYFFVC